MNIRSALREFGQKLPYPDGRLLLQALLGVDHAYLIAHDNEPLTAAQLATYQQWLARAEAGEPIPYIIGRAPFYGRDFHVSPAVLIPRPETELLVEEALRWSQHHPVSHIVDVGTGSGCIPVTLWCEWLAATRPTITAVDVSPAALTIAQQNAAVYRAAVNFLMSDLLKSISGRFDIITANLPYISDAEWTMLEVGVKSYEPEMALRGGLDGLALIRRLLAQATTHGQPDSLILLEIGWQQGTAAQQTAAHFFPEATISILKDYAGHDRIIKIETSRTTSSL